MTNVRMFTYVLWALSIMTLVMGGILRLTAIPIATLGPRSLVCLSVVLQLHATMLLLLEIAQRSRG